MQARDSGVSRSDFQISSLISSIAGRRSPEGDKSHQFSQLLSNINLCTRPYSIPCRHRVTLNVPPHFQPVKLIVAAQCEGQTPIVQSNHVYSQPVHSSIHSVGEQGMNGMSARLDIWTGSGMTSRLATGAAGSSLLTTGSGAGHPVQSSIHSVAEQKIIGLGEASRFFRSSLTAPGTEAPPSGLVRA
jgi:hypothetical protein